MESQDYDLLRQEQKEQEDRQLHQELLEEITLNLSNIFCQANLDEVSQDDIFDCIKAAYDDSNDTKIKIEVQNNQVFKIDANVDPIKNYTNLDLEDLPFEQQILRIFRSEGV